jgi:hypothetical protein
MGMRKQCCLIRNGENIKAIVSTAKSIYLMRLEMKIIIVPHIMTVGI